MNEIIYIVCILFLFDLLLTVMSPNTMWVAMCISYLLVDTGKSCNTETLLYHILNWWHEVQGKETSSDCRNAYRMHSRILLQGAYQLWIVHYCFCALMTIGLWRQGQECIYFLFTESQFHCSYYEYLVHFHYNWKLFFL